MSAPEYLGDGTRKVWEEVEARFTDAGDDVDRVAGPEMEAYCGQVARLRDARARIDREGLVVADEKGRPVAHPALDLERRANAEIRAWGDRFRPRRAVRRR